MCSVSDIKSMLSRIASSTLTVGQTNPSENTVCMCKSEDIKNLPSGLLKNVLTP